MSRRPARFTQADIARAIRAFDQVRGVAGTVKMCADGGVMIVPIDHKDTAQPEVEPKKRMVF